MDIKSSPGYGEGVLQTTNLSDDAQGGESRSEMKIHRL